MTTTSTDGRVPQHDPSRPAHAEPGCCYDDDDGGGGGGFDYGDGCDEDATISPTGEWDSDVEEDVDRERATREMQVRSFIKQESTYELDARAYHEDPFPKLVLHDRDGGGDVYAGNGLHSSVCRFRDGRTVHFAEVVTLHHPAEERELRSRARPALTAPPRGTMPRAAVVDTAIPLPLSTSFLEDGVRIFQGINDAIAAINRARRPTLVRCLNGGSRTVSCLVATVMMNELKTFRDAYLEVDAMMNPALINSTYESVLVTHVHLQMKRRQYTTVDISGIVAFLEKEGRE